MSPQNQPPSGAVANLPVFETLGAAFVAVAGQPVLLLRAMAGGLMLLAVAAIIFIALPNPLTGMLAVFAPLAAYSHFGVNWYRIMLLGPSGLVRPALRWDRRHWTFFGYGLALGSTLLVIYLTVTALVPVLPGAVVAVALWYLAARCCFLFPTLAVQEPYSFALAWQHTKGQGLRLTAALLMAAIPLYLMVSLIVSLVVFATMGEAFTALVELQQNGGFDPESTEAADAFRAAVEAIPPVTLISVKMIFEALTMVVLAVLFGIVALAFRICTGWVPDGGGLPAAPGDDGTDSEDR
jgi:hypothetical protein